MPRVRMVTVSYRYVEIRILEETRDPQPPAAPVRTVRPLSLPAGSARSLRTVVALMALAGAGTLARQAWRASLPVPRRGLPSGLGSRLPTGRRALPRGDV